jgi:hypothetical protein
VREAKWRAEIINPPSGVRFWAPGVGQGPTLWSCQSGLHLA